MFRKTIVVLLLGCVAGSVSIALSQEKSSSDPDVVKPNPAVISIPIDGEFYFGKVRVTQADIPEKVKQALKDKPPDDQIVYVKAGSFVRYGTVVSVIDTIRGAGFDRIGLVADKKKHPDAKPGPDTKRKGPVNISLRSSDAALSATPAVILIDVRSKTRLKLNAKPLLMSQLGGRLQQLLAGRSYQAVFIRAPGKMTYRDVVKVIDIAKSVGAAPIGLQIDHHE